MGFKLSPNTIITSTATYNKASTSEVEARKTIQIHNFAGSSEELIDSLGYNAFTFVEAGKQREGSKFFLDYILPESEKFNNPDDQIIFLVKVISKLYDINEQLKLDHKSSANKENFDAALKEAESELVKLVRQTPLYSSSQLGGRTVKQKIDEVEKNFHESEKLANPAFGGDCGLKAISEVTGKTVTRSDLKILQDAHKEFADPSSTEDKAKSLEVMFGGNVTNCKNYVRRVIDRALKNSELSNKDGAKDRLQADRARLEKIASFSDLITDKRLLSHINPPVDTNTFATKPGQWLETSDVLILLLRAGFDIVDFGVRPGHKPAKDEKTTLTAEHVTTGAIALIHNDAKPDLEYQRYQQPTANKPSPGSHWTGERKA